jgi:Ca2+-binding RTX toxin-like protein
VPVSHRIFGGASLAAAGALLALAFPSTASALTVEVEDEFPGGEIARIEAVASTAEPNEVTVRVTGESGGVQEVEIVDRLASTAVREGCRGGGAPGVPVTCQLPKQGPRSLPFSFSLGEGDNSLDASSLDGRVAYLGGMGADVFIGGSGDDEARPGGGGDTVRCNRGDDTVSAPRDPTGSNRYDLGRGFDFITYQLVRGRVEMFGPMVRTGTARDRLKGVESFRGSPRDDVLLALPSFTFSFQLYEQIDGTAGDDTIVGGDTGATLIGEDGDDTLIAGGRVLGSVGRPAPITYLVGEHGDDSYFGGDGVDVIREYAFAGGEPAPPDHHEIRSDDRARGAGGNDLIELGAGVDAALGNAGNDRLELGWGADLAGGGAGRDLLDGDLGLDRLSGGPGADRILAAYGSAPGSPRLGDRRDLVVCGAARDFALVNPWDRYRDCERVRPWMRAEKEGAVRK